jgi:glutamyl-tRNA reductase
MKLLVLGCSFRNTPVALRECLAFDAAKAGQTLEELNNRFGCETVILSTCNRVELYLARAEATAELEVEAVANFLAELHGLPSALVRPYLYLHHRRDAVRHLFRVTSSLDSLIVGEGQIAGQVRQAYEIAQQHQCAGPLLNALFQQALRVAKRVRTETSIARGKVSVSSVAVDYVREIFSHFGDKTVLVIGAGKMGELTLRHLRELHPQQILVTNRSAAKADAVALGCSGIAVPWEHLDEALINADIVLSTTGAPEPIVTWGRFQNVLARRKKNTLVVLDIAVPRDFDPRVHDGDRIFLFNIDDLKHIRAKTLQERFKFLPPAEAIVDQETERFVAAWTRRRIGPVIEKLTQEFENKRRAIVKQLRARLNGKLTEADQKYLEGAFRLLQNQILHGPISALTEEILHGASDSGGHTLLEALRKLFRLQE